MTGITVTPVVMKKINRVVVPAAAARAAAVLIRMKRNNGPKL